MKALIAGLLATGVGASAAAAFSSSAAELVLDLPVTVALLLPPADDEGSSGGAPLLDPATLQATLEQTLATHDVPFFDGAAWVPSGLQYAVRWSVAAHLPRDVLEEVEVALAATLHHRTGALAQAAARPPANGSGGGDALNLDAADAADAREGLPVPVRGVDAVLAAAAAAHFPGQTVLFVAAPRKTKVFGDVRLRRHRYHYSLRRDGDTSDSSSSSSSSRASSGGGCAAAWVGSGRFLVVDVAAGPCEWGSLAGGHAGHNIPFAGDGTQAPRSALEALGFRPATFTGSGRDDDEGGDEGDDDGDDTAGSGGSGGSGSSDSDSGSGSGVSKGGEGDESGSPSGGGDDDEGSGGSRRGGGGVAGLRALFSGPLLAGQVASLAASAVRSVLAPPAGSAGDPLHDGNARSGHHLAAVPAQLLVPVVVLSPRSAAWGGLSAAADQAFLARVFNASAVKALAAAALPPLLPPLGNGGGGPAPSRVTVVAAAHAVSEHPALGIALAKALRTRTNHRRLPAHAASALTSAEAGPAEAEPAFAVEEHTYVDASVLQRVLKAASGDQLAHDLLRDAGAFSGSTKAARARLQVEVALRDPTAFAHPPHWAVAPDDGDGSDGSSSSVASGLRVLPVFVLSDLAIGPSFSGDSDGDGDGGGVPLAFDHGLLVSASADCVVVLHSSERSDDLHHSPPRVPLESLVSRLGSRFAGRSGTGRSRGGSLVVGPTDATAAVAAGVLAALTAVAPAPLQVPPAQAPHRFDDRDPGAAARASRAAASASRDRDFRWAVGHHPFPPFGLLGGQPGQESSGSGSGSRGKGASGGGKGRGSRSTSSSSSSSGSSGVAGAPAGQWALSPVYSDGAARAATAANVHAAQAAIRGLAAALNGYERTVSRGLAHAGHAGHSLDVGSLDSVEAHPRTLRDAAASQAPPHSTSTFSSSGVVGVAVPEAALLAADNARARLAACVGALRGGSGLRASAADAAAAWRTEVAEQQQDLSDLQRPQQEALLAQQPLVVDRGLALALDGALSLRRKAVAAYAEHAGAAAAASAAAAAPGHLLGGKLGAALAAWQACCDHEVNLGGGHPAWRAPLVALGVAAVAGGVLWAAGRGLRRAARNSRRRQRLGLR